MIDFFGTFSKSGSFGIITKAKDVLLGTSPQNQYNIRIIKNRAVENQLLLKILDYIKDSFPRIYQIMRALM